VNIKSLLLILFLYVCLVWVGAALLVSGHRVQEVGLAWTAAGLILMLAFVIGASLLSWWRVRRARKPPIRPAAPPKPAPATHEDDAALAALMAEANAMLAKAPAYAAKPGKTPLSSLPLYLLVGSEGSGKTSTFVNSGLEPQLLAGQVTGATPLVSTRLCNLWLAHNSIFAELSGRVFGGELSRWSQLLRVLQGKAPIPWWRRLWGEPQAGWELRGVIGCCEVKELMGSSPDPQRWERYCRDWQERLRAVGEVFGVNFPVYFLFTKCDAIPYYPEFFRRLAETEANQVLGCTLPIPGTVLGHGAQAPLQAEVKRLTASFRPLYHALADRRLRHLAHEPDPAKRPAIYEFAREFKRNRSPLVQFLAEVIRAQSLRPGPVLRGYYFSGVREVETAAPDLAPSRADLSTPSLAFDGTRLFRSDGTQLSRVVEFSPKAERGRSVLRWMFASDLLQKVVLADSPCKERRQQICASTCIAGWRSPQYAASRRSCALLSCGPGHKTGDFCMTSNRPEPMPRRTQ